MPVRYRSTDRIVCARPFVTLSSAFASGTGRRNGTSIFASGLLIIHQQRVVNRAKKKRVNKKSLTSANNHTQPHMDTAFRPFWCDDDPVYRSLPVVPSNLRLQSCPDVAIKSHSMFKATSCIIRAARFVCVRVFVCVVTEAGKSWAGFDRLIVCIICNRCSRGANVPFLTGPGKLFWLKFCP